MESMWTVGAWDNMHLWEVSVEILRQLVEKFEEELNAAFASIFTLNDFDFDILRNEEGIVCRAYYMQIRFDYNHGMYTLNQVTKYYYAS
ncbi:hypothetical protein TNCT_190731 [Trichonephila clavata]|uniref:Uncharacterized protein n=2 Tax=Trichonephila clavata TaxID=2740835 RepID=A0A8X6GYQ6_TRICU|nr:hypothetical protein TNCT_190731 [Trichonephila clavata]